MTMARLFRLRCLSLVCCVAVVIGHRAGKVSTGIHRLVDTAKDINEKHKVVDKVSTIASVRREGGEGFPPLLV